MWYLKKVNQGILDEYVGKLKNGLAKRIKNSNMLTEEQKNVFTDDRLVHLLRDEPQPLFDLHLEIMKELIPEYDEREFDRLRTANRKIEGNRTAEEKLIVGKYSLLKTLLKVFGYDQALSQSKSKSYWLTRVKEQDVCTYCNRQYTFTVIKDLKNGKRENDDSRIARPALDHWFPESLYPIMSLSFYNLIPSCTICNSSAKGDALFKFETHIHPYLNEKPNPTFKFGYLPNGKRWTVDFIDVTDGKEKQMLDDFHLRELYHCHDNLEVSELLNLALKNNGTYLDRLFKNVLLDFTPMTKEEIYRMLFGTEMLLDNQDKRPLSKLKHDLLEEIGQVYGVNIVGKNE